MRNLYFILFSILFTPFLNAQFDQIFEHEVSEYQIQELVGHEILAQASDTDQTIFVQSQLGTDKYLTALGMDGTTQWQKEVEVAGNIAQLNANEDFIFVSDSTHNLYQYDKGGNLLGSINFYDSVESFIDTTNCTNDLYYKAFYANGATNNANLVVTYTINASNGCKFVDGLKVINYNFATEEYTEKFEFIPDNPTGSNFLDQGGYKLADQGFVIRVKFTDFSDHHSIEMDKNGEFVRYFEDTFNDDACVLQHTFRIGFYGNVIERYNQDLSYSHKYKCYFYSEYGIEAYFQGEVIPIDCERSLIGTTGLFCGQDSLISSDYGNYNFPSAPFILENESAFYEVQSATLTIIDYKNNSCIDQDMDGYSEVYDCDDIDTNINPDAIEIPDNGIDENCDGYDSLDKDEDGYYGADDCDDNNANVNPDQIEEPYNGLDDDCNEDTLDDDLDQDGFLFADDCDDSNASINPDQIEEPYNGLDDDCNEDTLDDDLDQDGFLLADDCDDTNASINPDAEDTPNNGIDEDCDGMDAISSTRDVSSFTINVYPNPFTKLLHINNTGNVTLEYKLYNPNSRHIRKGTAVNQIDFSTIQNGMYLLKIIDPQSNQFLCIKIVKTN